MTARRVLAAAAVTAAGLLIAVLTALASTLIYTGNLS